MFISQSVKTEATKKNNKVIELKKQFLIKVLDRMNLSKYKKCTSIWGSFSKIIEIINKYDGLDSKHTLYQLMNSSLADEKNMNILLGTRFCPKLYQKFIVALLFISLIVSAYLAFIFYRNEGIDKKNINEEIDKKDKDLYNNTNIYKILLCIIICEICVMLLVLCFEFFKYDIDYLIQIHYIHLLLKKCKESLKSIRDLQYEENIESFFVDKYYDELSSIYSQDVANFAHKIITIFSKYLLFENYVMIIEKSRLEFKSDAIILPALSVLIKEKYKNYKYKGRFDLKFLIKLTNSIRPRDR